MYFLGVDMGATKSVFALCGAEGRVISEARKGPGNFISLTREAFAGVIKDGIDDVCGSGRISRNDISYAALGCAGYGEVEDSERDIFEIASAALGHGRVYCTSDSVIGWAGSLGLEPGINVIAGTGSICFGVNAAGTSARVGGWGYMCDEGSGQWLGARTVNVFTRQSDGRLPRTRLYGLFREHFGLEDDLRFCETLNHELKAGMDTLAKVQYLTLRAYKEGDPYAARIYECAAWELLSQVGALRAKLAFPDGEQVRVSHSGGVFKAGDCILGPFKRGLAALDMKLVSPLLPPYMGAVLLAMREAGAGPDAGRVKALNDM
jgi:N-acetylglucosamine kinase-like BadF-type ATPase